MRNEKPLGRGKEPKIFWSTDGGKGLGDIVQYQ
jgi:hypothetical protein